MGRDVAPLTAQHLEEAAQVLGQAFLNDPAWLRLFEGPDEKERNRRMTRVFAASLAACLRTGSPLEVRDEGRLLAAATIYPPKAYPPPMSQQLTMLARSVWHGGLLARITWVILRRSLDMLGEISKEHPAGAHYYLEYIGVVPGFQGQGIGTCLCKALLHKADQEQMGCYLETANPRAIPLYQRLGFRMLREREILAVPMWFMWRDTKEA